LIGITIFTALSGEEGLHVLKQYPIHVIMSDQKMPNMTGIEFLEKAKTEFPNPIRIIVTAHREIKVFEEALKEGKIYDFHDKPWDLEYLERMLMEGFLAYTINDIMKILSQTRTLPIEKLIGERDRIFQVVTDWKDEIKFPEQLEKIEKAITLLDSEIMKRLQNSEWTIDEV
jgi:YesN/AraC family two-component response regulator